jgi:hypothetical protein
VESRRRDVTADNDAGGDTFVVNGRSDRSSNTASIYRGVSRQARIACRSTEIVITRGNAAVRSTRGSLPNLANIEGRSWLPWRPSIRTGGGVVVERVGHVIGDFTTTSTTISLKWPRTRTDSRARDVSPPHHVPVEWRSDTVIGADRPQDRSMAVRHR